MTLRFFSRFILLLLPLTSAVGNHPDGPLPTVKAQKRLHTSIQLVSSVKTVAPGATFTVGVLMKMDPGWHTYWKNSGEAGLPTRVQWKLPAGFAAGKIQWPLPHKYNETGEVLTYGYADENMLLVDIAAPAGVSAGSSVLLHADVEWLECEKICVPGSAVVELRLPVSATAPLPDHAALFEKYRRLIPGAMSGSTEFSLVSSTSGADLEIHLKAGGGQSFAVVKDEIPDLYPDPIDELAFGRTGVEAGHTEVTLRVPISVYEKSTGSYDFGGVIVYQMQGGERKAATFSVPLSKEFCASLPISGETTPQESVLDRTFSTVGSAGGGGPLALYLLYAFIGGLLLNIMPCVLPVIGLKVFGLVKMAGDNPANVRRLGWMFSLGILASFLVLALLVVVLKAAGEQVGWGFQFQEPMFVIAMSAVVFAFGLSLFGVFEVNLPGAAVAGVSGIVTKAGQQKSGYVASFSEGVFATILATPCTAPILGTALGFAFSQPAGIILLIFTVTSVGMALPYLLLTSRPAWMKFLPKPGEWMVTAKQFMGFLMMATLLWLLYVLGKQLGMEGIIWVSAFLLCVGIACWLIGRFATLTASRGAHLRTWVVAGVVVAVGYWFFLDYVLDVRSAIAGVSSVAQDKSEKDGQRIRWQPFSLDQLDAHLRGDKTVFIDFTADWCLTCKVNEKTVLADEQVIRKFESAGIVPIRADWTNRNPDITRLLSKFGRSGVPLYVIFPAGKTNQPVVLPEVITTNIVLEAIDKAVPPSTVSSLQ